MMFVARLAAKYMRPRCPHCKVEVTIRNVPGPCPHCGEKLHFCDRWRWPRGIACGFVALIPMYLLYHFDGTLVLFLKWWAFVCFLWLVLVVASYRLIALQPALFPYDALIGPDVWRTAW